MKIYLNVRVLNFQFTGVQRYVTEIWRRMGNIIVPVTPSRVFSSGAAGQLWEQIVLPGIVKGEYLISPNYSGPLSIKKQIITIHDLAPLDFSESLRKSYILWYRLIIPILAKRCDGIQTVSEFTKNKIIRLLKVDPEKIKVIPNGVDSRFFRQNFSTDLKQRFSALQLPEKYFLYVGSIQPRKNLLRLLGAWDKVESKISNDTWLILAGETAKANVFHSLQIRKMPNRAKFIGYVDDEILPLLYSNSIGFTFISLYEGFGLPVLEAMASGVPVIVSNSCALPEIVGDAGILVNPYSENEISEAILRLALDQNLRQDYAQKGYQRAVQFTWENTVEKLLTFIEELWGIKRE